jgi:hypothetical protein
VSQPWIAMHRRCGLQTDIAAMKSVPVVADEKLTAFMELKASIGSAKRTFRVRVAEHYGN